MERREFLDTLAGQIRMKRARLMIVEEMEAHIEDQKKEFMAEGMTAIEAEEAAVQEMGDPIEAGAALDRVHRPRMEWSVLAGVIFISVLGFVIQAFTAMTCRPEGTSDITVLMGAGVGKHLVYMASGIVLMLFICWVDYSFINKYAVRLWVMINTLLILCMIGSPILNGRPFYLLYASYLIIPFYAGILYHFRDQGLKGMIKSVLCLYVPLAIMAFYYMISSILITGSVSLILLNVSIFKKWFGERRRELYIKLWLFLGLTVEFAAVACVCYKGGIILAQYQLERIMAWLHPGQYKGSNYFALAVADAGEAVKEGSLYLAANMLDEIKSSYLWLYLFKSTGTWKGILCTVLVVIFFLFLFYIVRRQKNQLGYMISLGCALFLCIQTVMYIGMNFSVIPMGTAYMPFISSGGAFLLISYFYMGLFLSVCNNSRLVKN